MDISDWPRPSQEELPDLYEDIDKMVKVAETELREHFTITNSEAGERIQFGDADADDFLEAIDSDHEVMIALFQKTAGLPDREFERQYGVRDVGSRFRERKSSLKDVEEAQEFASALADLMPESLSLEATLYSFYKAWEGDQRRFYRMHYESEFLEFLNEQGFSAWKGNSLSGEPDIVIPESKPFDVIGEIRVIQQKDKQKRFKEFRTEAHEAHANFDDIQFVVVANLGKQYLEDHGRETVRSEITTGGASEIDAVFFHDERDEFVAQMEEWGVSKDPQQSLENLER
ncbi:hypothetical protein PNQ29_12840 [Halobacterium salinarum]|uniref:hypothetical protein n=1 Tax=Halobacterium salinarum TaxID=2242 RepID=UPI002557A231|nr:hypothetical protein [Halobacterium salinarum]MDL0120608.1 hypothetical protein [Halobacterium salinarum]